MIEFVAVMFTGKTWEVHYRVNGSVGVCILHCGIDTSNKITEFLLNEVF
jgi:hypothetical protein